MSTLAIDDQGLLVACPQCGQRNRLQFSKLGQPFRCGKCQNELSSPQDPMEVRTDSEFEAVISASNLPVLVDFWAPWCGPCRRVAPELVKVSRQGAGQWLVLKVNTDELPILASRFEIRGIPTLILFHSGREVRRQSGAMPANAIRQFLEQGTRPGEERGIDG